MPQTRPTAATALLALALAGGIASPAAAAEPAAPTAFDRTLAKTATYLGLSALGNFAYGAVTQGGWTAGGLFAVVSLTTEPVVYYLHESAWTVALAHTGLTERDALPLKATSYSVVNAARVLANGWVLTGSATAALGFLAFNLVGDTVAYTANEFAWLHLSPAPPR